MLVSSSENTVRIHYLRTSFDEQPVSCSKQYSLWQCLHVLMVAVLQSSQVRPQPKQSRCTPRALGKGNLSAFLEQQFRPQGGKKAVTVMRERMEAT
nr:hypothetical protein CFP56_16476 [Quercus suber]